MILDYHSRVGDAYDNAMAESFFTTLECEFIARRSWKTKTEVRLAVFTWESRAGTTHPITHMPVI